MDDSPGLKPWAEFCSPFGAQNKASARHGPLALNAEVEPDVLQACSGDRSEWLRKEYYMDRGSAPQGLQNSAQGFNPGNLQINGSP